MGKYSKYWQLMAADKKRTLVDPVCWLCGEIIDTTLDRYEPMAFELDHLIPKVQGGQDTEDNALPSHKRCNTLRSNAIQKAKRSGNALMAGVKQSRRW